MSKTNTRSPQIIQATSGASYVCPPWLDISDDEIAETLRDEFALVNMGLIPAKDMEFFTLTFKSDHLPELEQEIDGCEGNWCGYLIGNVTELDGEYSQVQVKMWPSAIVTLSDAEYIQEIAPLKYKRPTPQTYTEASRTYDG